MSALRASADARAAIVAALWWVTIEFAVRDLGLVGAGLVLFRLRLLPREGDVPPQLILLGVMSTGIALLALGGLFLLLLRRYRLGIRSLGYTPIRAVLLPGVVAGAVLASISSWGTHLLDNALFNPYGEAAMDRLFIAAGPAAAWLFLMVNGLLAPVVEEFGWRGYIQTRLGLAVRTVPAVLLTAGLFVLKHVVVDLSVDRTFSLAVGSLALGVVRLRWGTTASTLTHLVLNGVASAALLRLVLGGGR